MNWVDKIVDFSGKIGASALVVLIFLIVYDALMRYFFQSGSIALQELEWHLFDILLLLSLAYTFSHDAHVRVDIFYNHFSDRSRAWINFLGTLIFILPFSLLVIYLGIGFVELSFTQMEASADPGGLPYRFLIKSLIPLSFILMVLQSLKIIIISFKNIQRGM